MRGIGVEDLRQVSVPSVLRPLRKAIYAQYGLTVVKERICSPQDEPQTWGEWTVVEVGDDQPCAPVVSSDPQEVAMMACGYLSAAGALGSFHSKALLHQITDRFGRDCE